LHSTYEYCIGAFTPVCFCANRPPRLTPLMETWPEHRGVIVFVYC
jgi:hypothetical protein